MNQAASSAKRDEFAHVYREYFTMVYNAIYTKIENTDVAEDLCQEVFIILYNKFSID